MRPKDTPLTRFRNLLLAGLLALAPFGAFALNLGPVAASYDGVYYVTVYPTGNKPQPGCTTPAGWTLATKATGFGEICNVSATEFDFSGGGGSASNGFEYVYKDVASGDFQLKARVTNEYAGATGNFAGVGITISDGTADADVVHNVFSPLTANYAARSLSGVPGATTAANGASGATRPRYICAAYDESATESRVFESADGSVWLPVATFDYAFSTPIVGLYVNSASASESMTATMDNIELRTGGSAINCYSPDPPPPGAPTLVSSIGPQSGTQAVAFSLSCGANFSGATSYSIAGLQSGTNLSFNTATCALTGTPDADDVGNYTVTVTATNVTGSLDEPFSMSIIAPPSGNVLTIPTNGLAYQTIDCDTFEAGGRVDAGDILQFDGTTYGPLSIRDCTAGTPNNPIVIRNDPTDAAPATIQRTNTNKSFVLQITNSTNVVLDGTGGYNNGGTSTANCGTTGSSGAHAESTTCGIIITKDAAPLAQPSWYLRLDGTTGSGSDSTPGGLVVKGVKVLALTNTVGTGICYSLNDHDITGSANPGLWRENVYFQNNVGDHCGAEGEGFYIGGNDQDDPLPLRDIHFIDNLITDGGRDGINAKSVFSGTNEAIGNHIYRVGLPPTQDKQNSGIALESAASWTVSKNLIIGPGGNCIKLQQNPAYGADTASPDSTFTIENNFLQDCGGNPVEPQSAGYGFKSQGSASAGPSDTIVIFRNNTVDSPKGGMVDASGNNQQQAGDSCTAANNIFSSGGAAMLNDCTDGGGNRSETTANSKYTNSATGNLHILSTAPACSQGNSNAPSDDYDGDGRPLEAAREAGADETTACP